MMSYIIPGAVFPEGGGGKKAPESSDESSHFSQSQGAHAVAGTSRGRSHDSHMTISRVKLFHGETF